MEPVLDISNLVKTYGGRSNLYPALTGINLSVTQGEFMGVMGPSGSGKTTLLNIIATIDQPTGGTIRINGRESQKMRGGELAIQTGSWSAAFTDQLNRSLQQGLRVPFQGASYAIRQVLAQPINSLLLPSACTLVIPDALAGELPRAGAVTTLLYDYANPKDTLVERNLEQTIYAVGHGYWESLPERQASELVRETIIMFAGLYLEMILLMACATVLGLQQLIETVESAQHYQTLRHLGAGEPTLRRSISQQVTFYFFAPAGLAIVHSLFALGAFEKTFGSFVALSPWALLGSLALFLAVYGAYYLITLRSCVNLTRPPISPPC